jgi:hypothetical protein
MKKPQGGARPGAGRKPGTSAKVTALQLMQEFQTGIGRTFEAVLVDELNKSIAAGDHRLTRDYLLWIGSRVIADQTQVDITSAGLPVAPVINIVNGGNTI